MYLWITEYRPHAVVFGVVGLIGVQILFIETDDLRDRPGEIMPMVHQHIGEMASKTCSPGLVRKPFSTAPTFFLGSAPRNLCGIVAANDKRVNKLKK